MKLTKRQQDILEDMGVLAVYLFGSHAQGIAGPLSDIDIGVVFYGPERYRANTLNAYSKLYDLFSDVFADTPGEPDVVFLQFTPLALQYRALRDGKLLYESNRQARFRYQERVLKHNADMQHFYQLASRAILERI